MPLPVGPSQPLPALQRSVPQEPFVPAVTSEEFRGIRVLEGRTGRAEAGRGVDPATKGDAALVPPTTCQPPEFAL